MKYLKKYYVVLIFLIALISIYFNHFNNGFHFDDSHTIVENSAITDIRNIPSYFIDSTTFSTLPSNQSYRPLLTATFAIDYAITGSRNPIVFHTTSFIFFVIQLFVMYLVFNKLLDTFSGVESWNKYLSFFACCWYGFHGAIAETVNYVCARSDILSTFFILVAFLIYTNTTKYNKLYFIPLLLGLFSKEAALVFPLIVFCYEYLVRFNSLSFSALLKTFKITFIPLAFCITFYVLTKLMAPQWISGGVSRWEYLITQPYVILDYFLTFFYPTGLVADTDWVVFKTIFNIKTFIGVVFILAALWVIKIHLAQNKIIAFGVLWFLISVLPTSSLIPLAEVKNDHRLYLPYVGLVIAVTVYLKTLIVDKWEGSVITKNLIVNCLAISILVPNSMLVYYRNEIWDNSESLWKEVTEKAPNNGRGLMNYGLALMEKGEYVKAEKYFLRALNLWPNYSTLYVNLGVLNSALDKNKIAEDYFLKALQLNPKDPASYFYYGRFLNKLNRTQEAEKLLIETLKISPRHTDALNLLEIITRK